MKIGKAGIMEILTDVGCSEAEIKKFIGYWKNKKKSDQLRMLQIHRKDLLDNLHKYQKRIDRLDYLVFQMEKNNC